MRVYRFDGQSEVCPRYSVNALRDTLFCLALYMQKPDSLFLSGR
jgi:hypothetical protein